MTLASVQHAFADHLHDRPSGIAAALADTRGLAVYHHAYRATLRATLRDTYARTARWLGDDAFDATADTYVAATPSTSWTLADYGATFPDHLAVTLPDDGEAAELAWLEGALRRAFAAADEVPVDRASLTLVDWETASLTFAAGVATRTIAGDVPAIWHALGEDRTPPRILLDQPQGLIVWRDGLEPRFRTAEPGEAAAIAVLSRGASFAQMCGDAGADPARIGAWLARWLDDGLVVGVGDPAQADA